jgi:hypothetical protein
MSGKSAALPAEYRFRVEYDSLVLSVMEVSGIEPADGDVLSLSGRLGGAFALPKTAYLVHGSVKDGKKLYYLYLDMKNGPVRKMPMKVSFLDDNGTVVDSTVLSSAYISGIDDFSMDPVGDEASFARMEIVYV